MLDDLWDTPRSRRDYRQARLHALEQRGSEFLVSGRHGEHVCRAKQVGNLPVRDEAKEVDALTEAEPVREALWTVTDQHNGDAGHSRGRAYEDIDVLLRVESSNKDDAWSRDRFERIVSASSRILELGRHDAGRYDMDRRCDAVRSDEGSHPG